MTFVCSAGSAACGNALLAPGSPFLTKIRTLHPRPHTVDSVVRLAHALGGHRKRNRSLGRKAGTACAVPGCRPASGAACLSSLPSESNCATVRTPARFGIRGSLHPHPCGPDRLEVRSTLPSSGLLQCVRDLDSAARPTAATNAPGGAAREAGSYPSHAGGVCASEITCGALPSRRSASWTFSSAQGSSAHYAQRDAQRVFPRRQQSQRAPFMCGEDLAQGNARIAEASGGASAEEASRCATCGLRERVSREANARKADRWPCASEPGAHRQTGARPSPDGGSRPLVQDTPGQTQGAPKYGC